MYHCHIQLYFIGCPEICATVKGMPPLERFTHAFAADARPEAEILERSDAVFADWRGLDDEARAALSRGRKAGSELIVLAEAGQVRAVLDAMPEVKDVWTLPMSESEVRFRFLRWQQAFKQSKDCWQADYFLEACIDSAPDLVWFKDKDGVHEKVNKAFCKTVNKTKRQVQGRRHAYIWDVEHDDPACIASEEEVMRTGRTLVSEETVQTKTAQMLLTTFKSPLYDLDGSVMGTVGIGVDVTRERAYEQEIVEKKRTLEMLFSSLNCGVMCHTLDGSRIISVNRAALNLLGYNSLEELMADGFDLVAESVLDEDKPRLRECITSLKSVDDSVNIEYRVLHKDGEVLHILGNIKLVEKDGELFYQRFLLDFTDRKRQEERRWAEKDQEFRYQEQLFEMFSTFLSDNVDDIYMMMNGAGEKAEFVTPNIERVLGIPSEAILNDVEQLGYAEYITGGSVSYERLASMEPGMALEPMETERIHRKTGEKKWFRETVYCVSVQGRKKIIVYISDRTRERMSQNALTEALDIAQVANKAKSAFLSSVSHDIRTPMNAILGFVTLLKEEANDPDQVLEYTQKISVACQHLLGLINDVLDMNKIESGSAVLNINELNLAEIIGGINTIIRPQARAKDQSFEIFTTALKNEHLLGDKLRINQILINILSNAVKYTQAGGKIRMSVEELPQVDRNYSRLQFTISDNGKGMSEEFLQVIFDPFTRERGAALNQIQGTGLGMAITKNLVDLMNGTIRVSSKLGEGSTFVVELALRVQEKEEDPAFWTNHSLTRMIVADDDEDICRDVVKKMSKTGVEVHSATSGVQAIRMIRNAREAGRPYDLILLDWKMPDLDGLATARLIRKNYPIRIPILLFTAYDWVDIEAEASEVGIEHFLPKPFFMCNFKEAIQRMMGTVKKQPLPAAAAKKNALDGKHILVVDDIEVNRMILVKILNTLGAVCDVAEDGKKALEKFEASQPGEYDIIFMDIQMPVMNGHEATRAIRNCGHPSAQSVAIIAMTANAFVDDIRDALESGMDAHVPKPIVLDQLVQTVQEVLEKRGQVG